MTDTDLSPFDVLGVPEAASPDEIRKAYRKQALRYHPDRNPDDASAREKFLAVQEAYARLDTADPDAGYDAERVAANMQKAAREAERRRSGVGEGARGWQQMQIHLDRPRADLLAERLRTQGAIVGVLAGFALAGLLGAGLPLIVRWASVQAGSPMLLPVWAALAVGIGLGAIVAIVAVRRAEVTPWAVETHWQGLRDLRWDVLLSWEEIRGARHVGGKTLELALTEGAAGRIRPLVDADALGSGTVYRLPVHDVSVLLPIVRTQVERAKSAA